MSDRIDKYYNLTAFYNMNSRYEILLSTNKKQLLFLDLDFVVKEGEWFVDKGGRIHREDVARYLLKTAKEHLHSTKIVAIATQ